MGAKVANDVSSGIEFGRSLGGLHIYMYMALYPLKAPSKETLKHKYPGPLSRNFPRRDPERCGAPPGEWRPCC